MTMSKEYIEREAANAVILAECSPMVAAYLTDAVAAIPAADVRPVVLCRDCIFRSNEWTGCPKLNGTITGDEFFCKCGIKKREES